MVDDLAERGDHSGRILRLPDTPTDDESASSRLHRPINVFEKHFHGSGCGATENHHWNWRMTDDGFEVFDVAGVGDLEYISTEFPPDPACVGDVASVRLDDVGNARPVKFVREGRKGDSGVRMQLKRRLERDGIDVETTRILVRVSRRFTDT
jgi:hypothetical protein